MILCVTTLSVQTQFRNPKDAFGGGIQLCDEAQSHDAPHGLTLRHRKDVTGNEGGSDEETLKNEEYQDELILIICNNEIISPLLFVAVIAFMLAWE